MRNDSIEWDIHIMAFIVKFMIGFSMLLLMLAGAAARKMQDDPKNFWRDENDDIDDTDDNEEDTD